ncbi:MAG: DNA methylase, partial [Candidatus Odinarchaeota archaeon]
LKRSVGHLYPELFTTPLTPKSKEIVAYTINQTRNEAKIYFEETLKQSFREIHRVLKTNGITVIVYAHKTTEGWETVINALLDSGLTVTASWPITTEMRTRLVAKKTASLASSIYIVARKISKEDVGFYPEVKKELELYLERKLERLWEEGISGADFFIAGIGAGIEVFGKYRQVLDYKGNTIRADQLLEDIRAIVTNFAVNQILYNGFSAEISPLTRFYVLWRWNYQEIKVPYDDARKLAQSSGLDLEKVWNKGFIEKQREFVSVLGPKKREIKDVENSNELIDVLHHVLLLWEMGKQNGIVTRLSRNYGKKEIFYKVGQAISQSLTSSSKEKQLLDGFLSGKERIKKDLVEGLGKWFE